jgi:hypothetical protein
MKEELGHFSSTDPHKIEIMPKEEQFYHKSCN